MNSTRAASLLGLFLLAFPLAAQERRRIAPVRSAMIDVREVVQRDKGAPPQRKRPENERQINLPYNLPVPRDARGETFRVAPPAPAPDRFRAGGPLTPAPTFTVSDNLTVIPPDLGGAVGPDHFMTALNSEISFHDRNGGSPVTVNTNTFFANLVGGANVFDPKVVFDHFANRWVITACANSGSANSALLIAVSLTSDPTLTWKGYAFDADPGNTKWLDYPSIGLNAKWIVVSGNLFTINNNSFTNAQIWVFDRGQIATTAVTTAFILPPTLGFTHVPAMTYDPAQGTEYLINDWNGNSSGNGYTRIFTLTGPVGTPAFTATPLYPSVAAPWAQFVSPPEFLPQSGTTRKIAANDSRMHNAVYRNGALWCAQHVFLPAAASTRAAAQWWQIDPTSGNVQQFGRVDDATAQKFYAFPTIAVNASNDAILGYSSFAFNQFASASYSFRFHTDPPHFMQTPVTFKAGLAKYEKGAINRWGDYSSTVVVPDEFSLCTLQEYAELPLGPNDRWGGAWTCIVPPVPDLYVKDQPTDLGAEPNPSTLPIWESDDIWVRKQQAGLIRLPHEDAEYQVSSPNWVYAEVRNRGGVASPGGETFTLYWAKASSGLSWPSPWTGGIFFNSDPNMPMGDAICSQTLPSIAAGASQIVECSWQPPNPANYATAFGPDQNHFCLLARIIPSSGMTFPETTSLGGNVHNNNNIAWKNIQVYDLVAGKANPGFAVIANLAKEPMKVKVRFTALDANGAATLFRTGRVRVTAGGAIRELRPAGEFVRRAGNGVFDIIGDGATLQGVTLTPEQWGTLRLEYIPNQRGAKVTGFALRVTQIADEGGKERVIGGQTLVFGKVKGFNTSPTTQFVSIKAD